MKIPLVTILGLPLPMQTQTPLKYENTWDLSTGVTYPGIAVIQ
jgi:hypothetical protein